MRPPIDHLATPQHQDLVHGTTPRHRFLHQLLNPFALLLATAHIGVDRLLMPLPCLAAGAAMFVAHGRLLRLAHRSLRSTSG
ncbi:hypothetical protein ACFPM7_09470 [Actinokineospora guangxiensis]|uniref:Uncharacterized protein n=1 Tax=Actinokineospora guangxiensis TaxID=1490288 RepID=A0ABW0EIS2_9PSEU